MCIYAGMTEDEILALVVAASRAEMDDDASPEDVASVVRVELAPPRRLFVLTKWR